MDGDVKTEELDKVALFSKAKNVCQVPGVILGSVDGGNLALTVDVAVNTTGNVGELGNPMRKNKDRGIF